MQPLSNTGKTPLTELDRDWLLFLSTLMIEALRRVGVKA